MRRIAAIAVLVVFASLSAVDGLRCPDGCTDERDATSHANNPQPTDGACVLCVGCLHSFSVEALSPVALITARIARASGTDPRAVSLDPPDHPPRT